MTWPSHYKEVSGLHAVLEPIAAGWCVQDVGSRNGTFVRGERILGMRSLHPGEDLAVGRTKLVFRSAQPADATRTAGAAPPPELTRRERDVLRALCQPLLSSRMFAEPASPAPDRYRIGHHRGRGAAAPAAPLRQVRHHPRNRQPPQPAGQRSRPAWRDHPRRSGKPADMTSDVFDRTSVIWNRRTRFEDGAPYICWLPTTWPPRRSFWLVGAAQRFELPKQALAKKDVKLATRR